MFIWSEVSILLVPGAASTRIPLDFSHAPILLLWPLTNATLGGGPVGRQRMELVLAVAATVANARLELDEPLVHGLQESRVHLLHNVLQLVGVRGQVVHLHE